MEWTGGCNGFGYGMDWWLLYVWLWNGLVVVTVLVIEWTGGCYMFGYGMDWWLLHVWVMEWTGGCNGFGYGMD